MLFRADHVLAMIVVPIVMIALVDLPAVTRISGSRSERRRRTPTGRTCSASRSTTCTSRSGRSRRSSRRIAVAAADPDRRVLVIHIGDGRRELTAAADAGRRRDRPDGEPARGRSSPRSVSASSRTRSSGTRPTRVISDAFLVVVILAALLLQRGFFSRAAETGIATWRAIREVRPIPAELREPARGQGRSMGAARAARRVRAHAPAVGRPRSGGGGRPPLHLRDRRDLAW